MGFGIKTWLSAAAAAILNTAAMFYASIFAVPKQPYSTEVAPAAGVAVFLTALLCLAEYIYVGRGDEGRQRIYRFVQHNVLSFLAAYGGFVVYSAAGLQDKYVLDTAVFNSLIPSCFQQFFLVTAVGAIVCISITTINKTKHKKQDNTLAEQQAK